MGKGAKNRATTRRTASEKKKKKRGKNGRTEKTSNVTIQMKAIEQCFPVGPSFFVALFIPLIFWFLIAHQETTRNSG